MTFLPIIRRELAVAARRTATYRQRVIFAGVALACVSVLFAFSPMTRLSGAMMFQLVAWAGFIMCLLEGLRVAADTIALERREGTLGLLLLTDARGYDVVAGKVASAALQAFSTVVAMLPAFTLPLLMGGVTAGECWRVFLVLLGALLLALSVGIFVSSWSTGTLPAFGAALALLMVIFSPAVFQMLAGGPLAIDWISGPLPMMLRVMEPEFLNNPHVFWRATGGTVVACLSLFGGAALLLHRFPRLEAAHSNTTLQRWMRPTPGRSETWGGASSRSSPAVWLAERTLPGRKWLWGLLMTGLVGCFCAGMFAGQWAVMTIFVCEVVLGVAILLWAAAVAPLSLNSSRRNGALELLLCTPMSPQDIVRGQVDALYGYFMAPALIVAAGYAIVGGIGMGLANNSGFDSEGGIFAYGLFWFVYFVLNLHALAYTGLWNGLTNARVDRAIGKTVFAVLILPWITLVVPVLGCLGLVGWPVFWLYWASGRLNKRFRAESVKQFSAAQESGWLPWRAG